MRRIGFLIAIAMLLGAAEPSQPPSPAGPNSDQPPKQVPSQQTTPPQTDQRGTELFPLIVKTIPNTKTQEEATQSEADRTAKSAADWWMVKLTGLIAVIGIGQGFVFGLQARRLRQTIHKMDEIATGQTTDMSKSIAEAARAASAMEGASESLASQREFWRMQMRAYVTVVIGNGIYQDRDTRLRFEGKPLLVNTGHTPAHNVRHRIRADILPIPLARDIDWSLPPETETVGTVVGPNQNRILNAVVQRDIFDGEVDDIKTGKGRALVVWGTVNYDDVFGVRHYTNFCQFLTWSGKAAQQQIVGYYNHDHNDAD